MKEAILILFILILIGVTYLEEVDSDSQKKSAECFCNSQPLDSECKVIMTKGRSSSAYYVTYKQGGRWITKTDF